MLADVGSEVTLLEALPRLLPGVDADASDALARAFKKRGIAAHAGVRVTSIEGTKELTLGFEEGGSTQQVVVDKVIVSIGRAPRTAGVGLEAIGVALDERGFVKVDGQMRTNVAGVYAVGDVVPTPAARARRLRRGDRRDQDDPGRARDADRVRQGALGDLLPSRGGVRGAHRGAGARARSRRRDVGAPVRRRTAGR